MLQITEKIKDGLGGSKEVRKAVQEDYLFRRKIKKKGTLLQNSVNLALCWAFWLERYSKIFEDSNRGVKLIWDLVKFLDSFVVT